MVIIVWKNAGWRSAFQYMDSRSGSGSASRSAMGTRSGPWRTRSPSAV
jgi:hypothetical protein